MRHRIWKKTGRKCLPKNELAVILRNHFGLDNTCELQVKRLPATGNSCLFIASGGALPQKIFVKQVHTADSEKQFRSLVALSNQLGSYAYRVPRPITCLANHNIVCMECVEGPDLKKLLMNSSMHDDVKKNAIRRAGGWISHFHSTNRQDPRPIDFKRKIDDLKKCTEKSERYLAQDPVLAAANDWLVAGSHRLAGKSVARGIVHGDFKAENLIVTDCSIVGIDFCHDSIGSQLMDIAQFTNNVRLIGSTLGGRRYRNQTDSWANLLVNAYQESSGEISESTLKWLRIHHMLRYWGIEKSRMSPFGIFQTNWLRNEIGAVLEIE